MHTFEVKGGGGGAIFLKVSRAKLEYSLLAEISVLCQMTIFGKGKSGKKWKIHISKPCRVGNGRGAHKQSRFETENFCYKERKLPLISATNRIMLLKIKPEVHMINNCLI